MTERAAKDSRIRSGEPRGQDQQGQCVALRGEILTFLADPEYPNGDLNPDAWQHWSDGLVICRNGRIEAIGPADQLLPLLETDCALHDVRPGLILPGFIDTHIHFPQVDVMASYGETLMGWLNQYTFPTEQRLADATIARETADFFLKELLRNGTTSAVVYGTVHADSVQAFFEASEALNTRMICGKVLMDRHAPDGLRDTAEQGERETRKLIETWHGRGRQQVVITPRFAVTSTPEQLRSAGNLLREYPDVYLQTHLAENRHEIETVRGLFPEAQDYVDVYDRHGLLSPRSIFAHGIHLSDRERERLSQSGSQVAFCPTSNLFLGSGLLDLAGLEAAGVTTSIATDVGAGTSFSLLQTLAEAYKATHLQHQRFSPLKAFHRITLGNAKSLGLQAQIGTLAVGSEADLVVLDPAATPLLARRMQRCQSLQERLFAWMMLGDDRVISSTWVAGRCRHRRTTAPPEKEPSA